MKKFIRKMYVLQFLGMGVGAPEKEIIHDIRKLMGFHSKQQNKIRVLNIQIKNNIV